MTEQQLTQARADLALLDIEQLRTGVMLQLLNIEELTKERDAALEQNTILDARCAKLEAAAKLAMDAMDLVMYAVANGAITADVHVFLKAKSSLRQAGVQ